MDRALYTRLKHDKRKVVHVIVIGTKPDIIKQMPIYYELLKRNELVIICHTGQHYDFRNSKAALREFGISCDVNFRVRGSLNQKLSRIIKETSKLILDLKRLNKVIVPYVHGDTLTACGFAIGSIMERVAPVHVEAGLRTMTLKKAVLDYHVLRVKQGVFRYRDYKKDLKDIENYEYGSFEPFPEQIDTRIIDVVSALRFAPTKINSSNLCSERNLSSGIVAVGNTISDAVEMTLDKRQFGYLNNDQLGEYILVTIHRRENCMDRKRLGLIIDLLEKLLKSGENIVIIDHPMFRQSVNNFYRKWFNSILRRNKGVKRVKPIARYGDMLKLMAKSKAIVTDSGGLQEEAAIMNKKCAVLRYGTDRIEGVLCGKNVVAPIVNSDFMYEVVLGLINSADDRPRKDGCLYGKKVAQQLVAYVLSHIDEKDGLFVTEERRKSSGKS